MPRARGPRRGKGQGDGGAKGAEEVAAKVQGLKEDLQAQLAAMERGHAALETQAAKLEEVGESPEALFNYMQNAGIDPAKIAELGGEPEKLLAMLASSIGGVDVAQVAQIDDTLQKLDDLHLQVDHLARDRPAMAAVAAQVRQATAAQSGSQTCSRERRPR